MMVRWLVRWYCPQDTWFKIQDIAVRGRARYLSTTEASYNIVSERADGEEPFFFKIWMPNEVK